MWAACIQAEQQVQQVRSSSERQEAEFAGLQRDIETANQAKAAAQAEVHRYAAATSFCLGLACRVKLVLTVIRYRPVLSIHSRRLCFMLCPSALHYHWALQHLLLECGRALPPNNHTLAAVASGHVTQLLYPDSQMSWL